MALTNRYVYKDSFQNAVHSEVDFHRVYEQEHTWDAYLTKISKDHIELLEAFASDEISITTEAIPQKPTLPYKSFSKPSSKLKHKAFPISIPPSCGGSESQNPRVKTFELELCRNFNPNSWQLPRRSWLEWRLVLLAFQHSPISFISIDFEGQVQDPRGITQVGITSWNMRQGAPIWDTYLWGVSGKKSKSVGVAIEKAQWMKEKFNFSAANACFAESLDEIADTLDTIFGFLKETGFALVVHGGFNDLVGLRSMGVNLDGVSVLDTQKLDRDLRGLGEFRAASLERCLEVYKIPHKNLHNAGNDSFYTMALFNEIGNYVVRKFGV